MQRFESQSGQFMKVAPRLGTVLLLCWLAGCSSSPIRPTQTATPPPGLQTYFAPFVNGSPIAGQSPLTYTLDDGAGKFSQTTYVSVTEPGPQVVSAGNLTIGQRGLRSLGITVNDGTALPSGSPETGSFAVELADQSGGLVQMVGQPVQPLVAATQCPSTSTQTYQFVTIPARANDQLATGSLGQPPLYQQADNWNPATDTAYGSVDVTSSGSTVTFKNINQYILPPAGGAGGAPQPPQVPAQSDGSSITGACGPTFFGNVTNVPGQLVVTDPGNGQSSPPQAVMGISSTGLLVEDNGHNALSFLPNTPKTLPGLQYNNVLGAGTGAVGLPRSSSPLDTGTVVGKQYLGFIYEAGSANQGVTWSSNLASFGFSSVPTGCPPVKGNNPSSTIYGGDFPVKDPTGSSNGGFGQCDFVVDLGPQDSTNNGLYPQAKVWVGESYPGYSTAITYPFQAVAIAGQLDGKYAIFLIGQDSIQPWAIYLLQSN